MGYFKEKMRRFIQWAQSDDPAEETNYMHKSNMGQNRSKSALTMGNSSIDNHNGGLNFTVFTATGGKVIQTRTYNIATDQQRSTLYVITDKEDLGQELGHIITIESLSR